MKADGPSLEPGTAFRLNGDGFWDVAEVPEDVIRKAEFSGYLHIKGKDCAVFETPDEQQWAQKTPSAGLNVSSRLVRPAFRVAGSPGVSWTSPSLDEEEEDMARVSAEEGVEMPALFEAAHTSRLRDLSDADWQRLEGTSSWDVRSVDDAANIAKVCGRDVNRIMQGMAQGVGIPAPVILERADGSLRLVSGNARLMAARALGVKPKVLWVRAPD